MAQRTSTNHDNNDEIEEPVSKPGAFEPEPERKILNVPAEPEPNKTEAQWATWKKEQGNESAVADPENFNDEDIMKASTPKRKGPEQKFEMLRAFVESGMSFTRSQ